MSKKNVIDFEECKKLYDTYKNSSAFMTFPMAIMYLKKGDYKKAKQYLKETEEENPFILDFLLEENGRYIDEIENEYYLQENMKNIKIEKEKPSHQNTKMMTGFCYSLLNFFIGVL